MVPIEVNAIKTPTRVIQGNKSYFSSRYWPANMKTSKLMSITHPRLSAIPTTFLTDYNEPFFDVADFDVDEPGFI